MRCLRTTTVLFVAVFLFAFALTAQETATSVPNLIRFGGTLRDAQGAANASTTVGVTFAIYKQSNGGAPIWQETQNVTPDRVGQYNVVLGSTTASGLPNDLFSHQEERWLGVQIQGQEEQARVLLVSVPYAFKAHEAETLDGLPASAFVRTPSADAAGSTGTEIGSAANSLANGVTGTAVATGKTATHDRCRIR